MAFACITPEQRARCLIMVRFLINSSAAKKRCLQLVLSIASERLFKRLPKMRR